MARALLEQGADANAKEAWEETPLHMAARSGCYEVCELLLSYGADLNPMNSSEITPLLAAAQAGQEHTCELLLERGGVAGSADTDIPPILSALLMYRMIKPSTKAPVEEQELYDVDAY